MAINISQVQQNFHLGHPNKEWKDVIGIVLDGPCILNYYGWLSTIVVIANSIPVGVVVLNNIWTLKLHHLPIDAPFSLVVTSLQGALCCHQHHGVIWFLHSMNMKVLAINYSRNGISIAYLLPTRVLFHHLFVNIILPVPPFLLPMPQNNQPFSI